MKTSWNELLAVLISVLISVVLVGALAWSIAHTTGISLGAKWAELAAAAERRDGAVCSFDGPLPDPACTPGAVMTRDLETICRTSTAGRRNVSRLEHELAFSEYGIVYPQPRGAYEVDHLIPLELGGSNDMANLWPQPAAWPDSSIGPGFHEKDRVEDWLHRQVCSEGMPLEEAQRLMAHDWVAAWRHMQDQEGQ